MYLTYGEFPRKCKYSNFVEYLVNPSIILNEINPDLFKKGGRPPNK